MQRAESRVEMSKRSGRSMLRKRGNAGWKGRVGTDDSSLEYNPNVRNQQVKLMDFV